MRRLVTLLVVAVLLAGCGGMAPPGMTPAAVPSGPIDSSVPSGVEATEEPAAGVAGEPLTASEIQALQRGLDQPIAHANATEDLLIRSLAEGSGLVAVLGADAGQVMTDFLAAEREATRAELVRMGVDPDTIAALGGQASSRGGVRLAAAQAPGWNDDRAEAPSVPGAAFVTAVLAASADLLQIDSLNADARGHVSKLLRVHTKKAYGGLAMDFFEEAKIELERCPDSTGGARGVIHFWFFMHASGTYSGVNYDLIGSGRLDVKLAALANANADMVEVRSSADGGFTGRDQSDGNPKEWSFFRAKNFGVNLPVNGGTVDPNASSGSGGSAAGSPGQAAALLSLGNVLASRHGAAAERHWKSGACVILTVDPPNPSVKGKSRTVTVHLDAESGRDEVPVKGRLTVTPITGTFSPRTGSTPLQVKVTVPEGKPSAKAQLEHRSVRGIGKRELEVLAEFPLEWRGLLTHEATTTIPDVGMGRGMMHLNFTFRASGDVAPVVPADPQAAHPIVPLSLESATYTWAAEGKALGQNGMSSGSTSNVVTLDYSNPFWMVELPDGDYIAGEGFVDPVDMELHVFLVAMGDRNSSGTFNIGPVSDCVVSRDTNTNQVYLVFDLDDDFKVQDGGCADSLPPEATNGGDIVMQGTRKWTIHTVSLDPATGGNP